MQKLTKLRIGPARGYELSEATASNFFRGKRTRAAAVDAFAVTGAVGGDVDRALRDLESATYCAVDKQSHNM